MNTHLPADRAIVQPKVISGRFQFLRRSVHRKPFVVAVKKRRTTSLFGIRRGLDDIGPGEVAPPS